MRSGRLAAVPCPQHALPVRGSTPPSRVLDAQLNHPPAVPFDSDAALLPVSDDDGDNGDDTDDHGDTEAQESHPLQPLPTSSTATSAASAPEDVWDYSFEVPGSRSNKRIYTRAPFQWGEWTAEEWWDRFVFIQEQLEYLVYKHLRLLNIESCPSYNPRMVGTCREDARPSVVVVCREVDFTKIRNLFHKRAERRLCLFEKQPTGSRLRFPFASRVEKAESTIPHLGLVYHRTGTLTEPVNRLALDKPLLACLGDGGVSCGSTIHYGERSATLGVALEVGEIRGMLTVDHLFSSDATHTPPSSVLDGGSSRCDSPNSPLLWELDQTDSDSLWGDDDEYGDLNPDDSNPVEQGLLDTQAVTRSEPGSKEGEVLCSTKIDGSRCTAGDPAEWNVLASSAELGPLAPYLDWALTWPETSEPTTQNILLSRLNTVYPGDCGSDGVVLRGFHESPTAHLASIYIVSGIRGIVHGQILSLPSFLPSPLGQASCEAWTVIPDAPSGKHQHSSFNSTYCASNQIAQTGRIISGECGSVVVDKATNKVYGHIVGSDPLGHAYVVSLAHVFAQLSPCFDGKAWPRLSVPHDVRGGSRSPIEQSRLIGKSRESTDEPSQADEESFSTPLTTGGIKSFPEIDPPSHEELGALILPDQRCATPPRSDFRYEVTATAADYLYSPYQVSSDRQTPRSSAVDTYQYRPSAGLSAGPGQWLDDADLDGE